MEMTTNKSSTEREASLPPSPFASSESERQELERALLPSSSPSASPSSMTIQPPQNSPQQSRQSRQSGSQQHPYPTNATRQPHFFPTVTAVPVAMGEDAFEENFMAGASAPPMAMATPVASLCGMTQQQLNAVPDIKYAQQSASSFRKDKGDEDEILVRTEPFPPLSNDNEMGHAIPSAPLNYQQLTQSAQLRPTQLKQAQARGKIQSQADKSLVARVNREYRNGIQYENEEQVKAANERAARKGERWDEGLTVDEGVHRVGAVWGGEESEGGKKEEEDVRPYGTGDGYKVSEYDVAEYSTVEYDVSEYKSVYD